MRAVELDAFLALGLRLADAAGAEIRPRFRKAITVEEKPDLTPVTVADRAAEAAMRALIETHFPDHGILGEEFGDDRGDAEYVWVLDPIDGTKSFISGMPAWGTLIGLAHFGAPVFGMMHQPFTRERFSGDGGAARYRGPAGDRILQTRRCESLAEAVLFTTSPRLMEERDRRAFTKVEEEVRLSRYG